jgi:hypothetical protein
MVEISSIKNQNELVLLAYISNLTFQKQNDQMHHIRLNKITLPMILKHSSQAFYDLLSKKLIS